MPFRGGSAVERSPLRLQPSGCIQHRTTVPSTRPAEPVEELGASEAALVAPEFPRGERDVVGRPARLRLVEVEHGHRLVGEPEVGELGTGCYGAIESTKAYASWAMARQRSMPSSNGTLAHSRMG